jgi:hypothetical protein
MTSARQVASRRKAARGGKCGTGGHGSGRRHCSVYLVGRRSGVAGVGPYGGFVTGPDQRRPHRPGRYADLTDYIDAAGGEWSSSRAEIAAATAAVVVAAGRSEDARSGLVDLADRVGLETLAALWRDADPVSLPGALWALYLLRQWCHAQADEVARLWRAGQGLAPADAVVAGVPDYADVAAVERVVDAVLTGAYRGDFAVALERAAAMFRVIAAGRRELADSADEPSPAAGQAAASPAGAGARELADRNDRVADALTAAAARWRAGTLR